MFAPSLTTETPAEAVAALAPAPPRDIAPRSARTRRRILDDRFLSPGGTWTAPRPAH